MIRSCRYYLFLALTFAAISAAADISETDLQLAARTLTFMEQPLSGRVRLGIVYSSASPRSLNQAQALAAQLESGLIVGNIELRPVLVPIERADTADVDLFLMTEFLPPESSHLATISARRQITCVTTDIRQVESGACAIAIRSQPKIEIIVNREAAANSGVRFATAFRVMVTEL